MPSLPSDIARIPVPTPWPVGPVNVYLVEGDPLTLIDAGPRTPEAMTALEAGCAERGRRVADVELLVLTHQHHDHVGQAAEIVRRSGASVAAYGPLAAGLSDIHGMLDAGDVFTRTLAVRNGVSAAEAEAMRELGQGYRRFVESVNVDVSLHDGDEIRIGERTGRVYHRPGHSPSDLVLHDARDGLLVAGDHLLPRVSSNPVAHLPLDADDPATAALDRKRVRPLMDYLSSLAATRDLSCRLALPGHGPPFGDIAALVEARARLHRERAEDILEALRAGPRTARQLIDALWDRLPAAQLFLGLSEVLAHLDLLREEARLVEQTERGVVLNRAAVPRISAGRAVA